MADHTPTRAGSRLRDKVAFGQFAKKRAKIMLRCITVNFEVIKDPVAHFIRQIARSQAFPQQGTNRVEAKIGAVGEM
jgi:hypothetical protein